MSHRRQPPTVNGQMPALGVDSGDNDDPYAERGDPPLDDRARQMKLGARRRFFAAVDDDVAKLMKADKRKADGTTSSPH